MALIRYLAEKGDGTEARRKLLLIDEPELYLHPQGVEQIRVALEALSLNRYQVIFSTHSPLLLDREHAQNAVIVRKPTPQNGTIARKPLSKAVEDALAEHGHAGRVLFQLSNAAQVFFSDRVLLNEGKTEEALLPIFYGRYIGRNPRADRTGLVAIQGSGNFHHARAVLNAMDIDAKIVADLDYGFRYAKEILGLEPDLAVTKSILAGLKQPDGNAVPLDGGGLPTKGKGTKWAAAETWSLFAKDKEAVKIAEARHEAFKKNGVWIWKQGTIEDVLGVSDKGEEAIQAMEEQLQKLTKAEIQTKYPAIAEFLDWLIQ